MEDQGAIRVTEVAPIPGEACSKIDHTYIQNPRT